MARNLTSGTAAETSKSRVYPVVFCEIDFADATSYVWSGIGNKSWNSQTWIGIGHLGKIDPIEEGTDIQARGCVLTLSGIPQAMLNEALYQCRQGQPVKIWAGFLDASGNVIVDPFQSFAGRLDVPTIDEGAETATISITAESRLIDLQRNRERRYTPDDQALDFSTDQGFNYVPSLQEVSMVWGKGTSIPVKTGGGNRGGSGGGFGSAGGHSGRLAE
jgi:hypothetical protein